MDHPFQIPASSRARPSGSTIDQMLRTRSSNTHHSGGELPADEWARHHADEVSQNICARRIYARPWAVPREKLREEEPCGHYRKDALDQAVGEEPHGTSLAESTRHGGLKSGSREKKSRCDGS